jgi:hypothetical protein
MATQSNVPQLIHRSKSAVILDRLQSYRSDGLPSPQLKVIPKVVSFPAKQNERLARQAFVESLHWRSRVHLFTLQALQFLIPEPPDDDTESGPDDCPSVRY